MTTIARQQQIYNSHNGGTAGNSALSITLLSSTDETVSIADKVAIACNLLNSHIFTNLSAGLPLTLYIGELSSCYTCELSYSHMGFTVSR